MSMSVRERVLASGDDVCAAFQERNDVVRLCLIALLAETNALLIGPPGTAKSAVLRALASHVTGVKYAEKLMSKFTLKDELVGPPKVSALRDHDLYERNMVGTPADAEIFFCDEVFRASGVALDVLLPMINEHVYDGKPLPQRTCIGATNFGTKDDYLEAIDDRFLLRMIVEGIKAPANFDVLLVGGADPSKRSYTPNPAHIWTKGEWDTAIAEIGRVNLPKGVREEIGKLWAKCKLSGIYVSDRRWRALVRVLQTTAWLDGCTDVEPDHLDILRHGLWRKPEDRSVVFALLDTLDSGDVKYMTDTSDAFLRMCASWQTLPVLDKEAEASKILAARKTTRAAIKAKMASSTSRGKRKGAEVLLRIDDGYLPVAENLCGQMGLPKEMAKEIIAKDA